jgi:hypothetical protein
MPIFRFIALIALVSVSLVAGIAAAFRLTRPRLHSAVGFHTSDLALVDSTLVYPSQHAGQSSSLFRGDSSPAKILELPKADTDFVGYWGGYVHSSIQRLSPDLIGASPDRVSVVFGRQGDTVFMAGELFSAPNQRIMHPPKARLVDARVAIVEYEATDNELYYIYSHRFRLNDASAISYRSTVDLYDLNSHSLVGVVTQRATLKRLLTPRDQVQFARPARNQAPRAEISARGSFARH